MEIQELSRSTNSQIMRPIIDAFGFRSETQIAILDNFERELKEIGTNRVVLVGTFEHLPIATVQLILQNADNNPELANGRDIAHVHGLWVRKDFQRRGFAIKMMVRCEVLAKERGITLLTLGVNDYNEGAIALYKKLGYSTFSEAVGRTSQKRLFLMRKQI